MCLKHFLVNRVNRIRYPPESGEPNAGLRRAAHRPTVPDYRATTGARRIGASDRHGAGIVKRSEPGRSPIPSTPDIGLVARRRSREAGRGPAGYRHRHGAYLLQGTVSPLRCEGRAELMAWFFRQAYPRGVLPPQSIDRCQSLCPKKRIYTDSPEMPDIGAVEYP